MKVPACPRCDATQTLKIADSPVAGKWEVYRCPSCNFVWRSTEQFDELAKLSSQMVEQAVSFWS